MHGRLKVKTTAQQQEEKRKEREKKVKIFTGAMKQIFVQRGNDDLMDSTMQLTQQVLSSNPDIYTLWNIRKEIFMKKLEAEEEIDKLLQEELDFLQNCLQVNPKSYGVWNHRMFTMLKMKSPTWFRELKLCNLFLQYDERNFHCWDYRRFVVKQSNVSAEEELKYTTEKIKENFSNYSSWHNRSKLLPQVFPDESGKVKEEELLKEFELVQNAFFTDPNDQSAWFYQRWLLGRKKETPRLISLIVKRSSRSLIATFSQDVKKCDLCESCSISGQDNKLDWKPLVQTHSNVSHSWVGQLNLTANESSVCIKFPKITIDQNYVVEISADLDSAHLSWEKHFRDERNLFSDTHTEAKTVVLESELEACQILLEEEPDNKWTMLTIVYLMKALNGIKHAEAITEMIANLVEIDPMRKGYYQHLRSKFNFENKLQEIYNKEESITELDLSHQELNTVCRLEYLSTCEKLNLSHNNITNFDFIASLPCLKSIDLSNNNKTISQVDIDVLTASFSGLNVLV